ncbi:MAG: hypothetical protein ACSHX8_10745 [Opitutaceae bacterium]
MNQVTDIETLTKLLDRAEASLRPRSDDPFFSASFDTVEDLANCIQKRKNELELRTLDEKGKNELWGIFAPTCDWDDAGGDSLLGNQIFEHLNKPTTNRPNEA